MKWRGDKSSFLFVDSFRFSIKSVKSSFSSSLIILSISLSRILALSLFSWIIVSVSLIFKGSLFSFFPFSPLYICISLCPHILILVSLSLISLFLHLWSLPLTFLFLSKTHFLNNSVFLFMSFFPIFVTFLFLSKYLFSLCIFFFLFQTLSSVSQILFFYPNSISLYIFHSHFFSQTKPNLLIKISIFKDIFRCHISALGTVRAMSFKKF